MSVDLLPNDEAFLRQIVAGGRFPNEREALGHAIHLLREEEETIADIREGLASIERGEGIPLSDVVAHMSAKFNIPRTL